MLVLGLLLALAAAGVARADTTLAPTPAPVDTSAERPGRRRHDDVRRTRPRPPRTSRSRRTDPATTRRPPPGRAGRPGAGPRDPRPGHRRPRRHHAERRRRHDHPDDPGRPGSPSSSTRRRPLPPSRRRRHSELTDPSVPADNPPAGLDGSKPDTPPATAAARPDRAPDTTPVTDSPDVPALAGPVGHLPGLPALGRPDAYTVRAVGGPDAPSTAAAAHAKRVAAAAAERGGLALLGARAAPLGSVPAGPGPPAARGAKLSRTLSSTFATRGSSSTRITALGDAALLNVSLPGGKGQSAGSRLLQFLAGYFVPPGGAPSSHLLLVVELALLGLLTALVLPRSLLLRLTERAGAVHAGYRAVALRPG